MNDDRFSVDDATVEDIFRSVVLPTLTGIPRTQPRAIWMGGQGGSGKSSAEAAVLDALGGDGVIRVDGDDYLALHPHYYDAVADGDREAANKCSEFSGRLWRKVIDHVIEQRYDVLVSSPLANADWALDRLSEFDDAGYDNTTCFVAVHAARSRLGILERYASQRELHGHGRFLASEIHDWLYVGVLDTAEAIEASRLASTEIVMSRDAEIVWSNQRGPGGDWISPPGITTAIEQERSRHWSAPERDAVRSSAAELLTRLPDDLHAAVSDAVALIPGAHPRHREYGMLSTTELDQAIDDEQERLEPLHTAYHLARQWAHELAEGNASIDGVITASDRVTSAAAALREATRERMDGLAFEQQLRIEHPPAVATAESRVRAGHVASRSSAAVLRPPATSTRTSPANENHASARPPSLPGSMPQQAPEPPAPTR